jgi:septal ring factor EnvC (AmiA/AmiB activator)
MSFTDADLLKKPGFIGDYARFLTLAKKEGKAENFEMKWNPLYLFEKWISEHGSAAILRDHNALLKTQKEALESEISALKLHIKELETERDFYKTKAENLQSQLDIASKEIDKLNYVRIGLKDQMKLQDRIDQLQAMNADLESQLRGKILGW